MLASITRSLGWPEASSMVSGLRHFAKTAPAFLYSSSRAASESSPCITVLPPWPGSAYTFRCGLTPGRMPSAFRRSGNSGVPALVLRWYSVSGSRMAAHR